MANKALKPSNVGTNGSSGLKRKSPLKAEKLSPDDDVSDVGPETDDTEISAGESDNELDSQEEIEESEKVNTKTSSSKKQKTLSAAEVRAARSATETFKSNIFKLQVDEVLKEISVEEKYAVQARKFLFSVREAIGATKAMGPFDFKSAQKSVNTRIPIPREAETTQDIKYKFSYIPPALEGINVIGSWSLHTTVRRPGRASGIDLYVPMDKSLFEQKDYLDFRYHRKKAYFLASLASQLAGIDKLSLEPRFEYFNGHTLRPTLQLVPTGSLAKLGKRLTIHIHTGPPTDIFPLQKLSRDRNANREVEGPTPVYNWSVLADTFAMPLLRYLHYTSSVAPAFNDAVRLGALWLLQREWGSDPAKGGFGAFEFAMLMASLLNGGSKSGMKRLLPGYSSYQLFKGTLLYIAEESCISLAPSFGTEGAGPTRLIGKEKGLVFDDCGLDILANMPHWASKLLRHDSQLAVDMLNDTTRDRFHALFLKSVSAPHLCFDTHFDLSLPEPENPSEASEEIASILHCAWGQRYIAMKVVPKESHSHGTLNSTWSLSSDPPKNEAAEFQVCAVLDGDHADKRVTFAGAEVDNDSDAFKSFWGPKASLRRFQDGSIKDAVVWEPSLKPITLEAASYSLEKHLDATISAPTSLESTLLKHTVPDARMRHTTSPPGTGFAAMNTSFQKLGQSLIELRSSLPVRIIAVFGTSAALRSASLVEPQPFNPEHTAEGIIEMESSTRWPSDIEASEKVKSAFLIKIAETIRELQSQYFVVIGLEPCVDDPTVESAFATIQTPEGFYFKLRIVSRSTTNKQPSELIALSDHTRLMTTMTQRYPGSLSTSIRLVKLWLEKQMLMTHISEPAVELLVLHVFVNSSPWSPPVSGATGFWRALDIIASWDWHENALYLDVDKHIDEEAEVENNIEHQKIVTGCDMDYSLFQSMNAAFEKQRKQDPALTQAPWVVFTKLDLSGIKWTSWEPRSRVAALIAARATALSRAAKPGKPIFKANIADFDLAWSVVGPKTTLSKHKNIAVSNPQKAIIGSHRVTHDLVDALIKLYGNSLVLFYSGSLDNSANTEHTLCAIWNRTALDSMKKIKANVPYPIRKTKDTYSLDKEALLLEIERLGSGMLHRIRN